MSAIAQKGRPFGLNLRPLSDSDRHLAALMSGRLHCFFRTEECIFEV